MGVYIKGMEMPKSCDDCILNNGITCYAVPDYKEDGVVGRTDDRPDWCPLVPVQPHGRLGDLDRLEKMFADIANAPYSGFDGEESFYSADDAAQIIRLAPTIIPAEPCNNL